MSPYNPTLFMSDDFSTSRWECKSRENVESGMKAVLIAYNGLILTFAAFVSYKVGFHWFRVEMHFIIDACSLL